MDHCSLLSKFCGVNECGTKRYYEGNLLLDLLLIIGLIKLIFVSKFPTATHNALESNPNSLLWFINVHNLATAYFNFLILLHIPLFLLQAHNPLIFCSSNSTACFCLDCNSPNTLHFCHQILAFWLIIPSKVSIQILGIFTTTAINFLLFFVVDVYLLFPHYI